MTGSILVIAAHPDDEVLGCGGTLARHASAGEPVHVLILAEGATSRDAAGNRKSRAKEIEQLRDAARAAAQALGAEAPRFAGMPDNRIDSLDLLDVVKVVEQVVAELAPRTVYTHHSGDLNIDHRITHQAVLTACRPLPGGPVQAIYGYETVSSTEWNGPDASSAFRPARFVGVTAHFDAKLRALDCYASEMRPFPHARSRENVEALARFRGASVGLAAAEAFTVIREVER